MTKKYKHRIKTLDGIIEVESDVPQQPLPPKKTPEEMEAERQKLYPDTSNATYLQYSCHFCGNEFYLINPIRAPNMNPMSDGFICIYLDKYRNYYDDNSNDKDMGRLMPVCRSCFKEMTDKDEHITIKPWG